MLPKITQVKTRRTAKKTKILSWRMLTKHDWLAYNREKKKAFCSTCTAHRETQKGAFNSKYGEGFDNWKKGAEKMKDHEESFVHRAAYATMARAKAQSQQPSAHFKFKSCSYGSKVLFLILTL